MSLQQEILNGESRTLEYKVELPEDSENGSSLSLLLRMGRAANLLLA